MPAIITGDVIHSSLLRSNDRKLLLDALDYSLGVWSEDFGMQFEIFRGDSFQCLLAQKKEALRMALVIKCFIKSINSSEPGEILRKGKQKTSLLLPVWEFDARLFIGIGEIEKTDEPIGRSQGEAFVLSGRGLDTMKNKRQSLGIATKDRYHDELVTELILIDHIIYRMTALQSEVIYLKLLGYNETEIGKELHINQSAVNQRSISAGWNAVHRLVQRYETIYSNE